MPKVSAKDRLDHLEPLIATYRLEAHALPEVEFIDSEEMGEPFRKLLVHDDDMTPTLEAHYNETMGLEILCKRIGTNELRRQVILVGEATGRHVQFGAIRIALDRFDPEPRRHITECRIPLGTLLHRYQIPHWGHPSAFFRLQPDRFITQALTTPADLPVFGRCNAIHHTDGGLLAQIVEILPNVEG